MISNDVLPSVLMDEEDRQREIAAFRSANAEYYRHVEWCSILVGGNSKNLKYAGFRHN